jgi:aspartate kinase
MIKEGVAMKYIVQKFGGSSLKDEDGRTRASNHVKDAVKNGYKVVVVVSAMGRGGDPYATDTLIDLVKGNTAAISNREWDLLLSCGETISAVVFTNMLSQSGLKAMAMTGAQAGFRTNGEHRDAKIIDMNCNHLKQSLKEHDIVVVTGFQGLSPDGEVTTIGRGGSDTSAAALGTVLGAEWIDIFTDVDGVMTADPRIVEKARSLSVVTYNEICNLAYQGAKVIHPRAVEIAMQAKTPIRVRSTYSTDPGTLITSLFKESPGRDVQERLITGIAHVGEVTQIKVNANKDEYDLQEKVFKAMAENDISIDFINISPNGVVYTVTDEKSDKAIGILKNIGYEPEVFRHCAKVSTVGAGMTGTPGVMAKIVHALTEKGIQILQSADSHTTIWVLVKQDDLFEAVNALHQIFDLHKADNDFEMQANVKRD